MRTNKDRISKEYFQMTPAPLTYFTQDHAVSMTLRDYFAGMAMQATVDAWIQRNIYPPTDYDVAQNAYRVADAMMKAREA